MLRVFVCVALLTGPLPAFAQSQTASQQSPAAKQDPGARLVCRSVEQIGSRLGTKRVCMTAQQWDEQRRTDREHTEGTQQRTFQPGG